MRYALLRMVDADNNNNKDYEMEQISDSQFIARYGRYGSAKQEKTYSIALFDNLYNQKIAKGYRDVTHTVKIIGKVEKKTDTGFSSIPDKEIRQLVDELLMYANVYIKQVYSIQKELVTHEMIDEAQELIDLLWICSDYSTTISFNAGLQKLLTIIPQRISNVSDIMAKEVSEMKQIVEDQEIRLNTLRSLLDTERDLNEHNDEEPLGETILDHFGISLRKATDEEASFITHKLEAEHRPMLTGIYKIVQKDSLKQHEDYMKKWDMDKSNVHYYFHGTPNQCVWPIMKTSLKLNTKSTRHGRAFGFAHYLAPTSKKSIKYTSMRGSSQSHGNSNTFFMFVINTVYKNCYHVGEGDRNLPGISNYDEAAIRKRGYDAYYAHAGSFFGDFGGRWRVVNPEIMVYNDGAVLPEYLLRFNLKKSSKSKIA